MNGVRHAGAFVIQFRAGADGGPGELAGRVEHVASGRTAQFQSVQELPELLKRMLDESWPTDGGRP